MKQGSRMAALLLCAALCCYSLRTLATSMRQKRSFCVASG